MSAADHGNGPEHEGDQMMAAEYVLGVLSLSDRTIASLRADTEPAFARLVDQWETHFSPIAGGYDPIDPPLSVKQKIDRRLFGTAGSAASEGHNWWNSLTLWRAMTGGALTALVLLIAVPYLTRPAEYRLVASLAAETSDVRYLAVFDGGRGEVGLSHISGERETGQDFELWVIEPDKSPVSMGVVPGGATVRIELSDELRRMLAAGATLAITLEPDGGSPSGKPTGPVVAAGNLLDI
ncbi:anti-sigma factor [Mesorhizobium sp. NBSH29]|uniref:anti-sigma factor n=1 Tax=Mesorhizobium sp. NBSH29 TaxID=2654249 RepID=UPI0018965500|nr:anti-sigma factor [Mesorhizobium sp. NBSH29]QPC86607.1 anti-sigma factor [Mesorhizobium sp. NBSH29]